MSQIKLLHSGGNGVIISAPDSNPASDRTLKLPSDADGTILTSNSSVGKILNVAFTNVTTTSSVSVATGSYVDSPATVTITSTVLNSKFIISGAIGGESTYHDHATGFALRRVIGGTTELINVGAADGNRTRFTAIMNQGYTAADNSSTPSTVSFAPYVDAPNQAAGTAITYKFAVGNTVYNSATGTFYFGRTVTDTNGFNFERLPCNITVMEVAP